MDVLITVLIGGASGVLIGTAGAKLWAIAGMRLAWPQGANFLSLHLSSGFVIAVEVLVAVAALALANTCLACLILAGVYAAFVIGAITLRGQECGCFGVSGMKVGRLHICGCALAAAALTSAAVLGDAVASPVPARLAIAATSALVVMVPIALWNRRSRQEPAPSAEYDRLLVVLSPSCTACAALKIMEKHEVNDIEADGTIRWIDRDSEPGTRLREGGVHVSVFPSVVFMSTADPSGARVESGLQECREVLQSWRERHLLSQP